MFILIQSQAEKRAGDTMILDSVAGHRKTFDQLVAFLGSSASSIELAASRGPCPLCSDWPTLRFFRMVKSDGKVRTEELFGAVLQVSGRPALLTRYIENFRFEPGADGEHRHPEQSLEGDIDPDSASIIVEVDDP